MLFRPGVEDFRTIGRVTGMVVYGVGGVMLAFVAIAWALGERNEAYAFLVGASLALLIGAGSRILLPGPSRIDPTRALAAVASVWIVAPVFGSVPLLLSGHYASAIDAYIEAVSGFATVGMTLVNDLDHLAYSVNLWRHSMHVIGGIGIIVVVLTIFASASGALGVLYAGEGREERILPNVVHTGQFILRVSLAYAVLGLGSLWAALVATGWSASGALYHAYSLWATAFYTAGFTPMTASAGMYRSPLVEALLVMLMFAGAFSFALHYQLWQRRHGELWHNLQVRSLTVSMLTVLALLVLGLARFGTYEGFTQLFRQGLFQTISAHTTTGLSTVPERVFVTDWGILAPAMIVVALGLGGMAGSTAGGIKSVRVGVLAVGLMRDVRRSLLPEGAVVVQGYHLQGRRILHDEQLRAAAILLLLFLLSYLGGGMVGLFYGYDLETALFESTAATATGGLSVGLMRPELELPLKLVYALQMIVGRLEFIAVLALSGYIAAIARGRT